MEKSRKANRNNRNRVREFRLRALIENQSDLAKITGIHASVINAIENGRRPLSAQYAIRIANAVGCTLDQLYGRDHS